jgi:hypothetical protein
LHGASSSKPRPEIGPIACFAFGKPVALHLALRLGFAGRHDSKSSETGVGLRIAKSKLACMSIESFITMIQTTFKHRFRNPQADSAGCRSKLPPGLGALRPGVITLETSLVNAGFDSIRFEPWFFHFFPRSFLGLASRSRV